MFCSLLDHVRNSSAANSRKPDGEIREIRPITGFHWVIIGVNQQIINCQTGNRFLPSFPHSYISFSSGLFVGTRVAGHPVDVTRLDAATRAAETTALRISLEYHHPTSILIRT